MPEAFACFDLDERLRVLKYACAHRCGCAHAYLGFEPLDLSVLVFQLSAKLIGCNLFGLQDLDQMDVLLHQDLALDDDVRVANRGHEEEHRPICNYNTLSRTFHVTFMLVSRM